MTSSTCTKCAQGFVGAYVKKKVMGQPKLIKCMFSCSCHMGRRMESVPSIEDAVAKGQIFGEPLEPDDNGPNTKDPGE